MKNIYICGDLKLHVAATSEGFWTGAGNFRVSENGGRVFVCGSDDDNDDDEDGQEGEPDSACAHRVLKKVLGLIKRRKGKRKRVTIWSSGIFDNNT